MLWVARLSSHLAMTPRSVLTKQRAQGKLWIGGVDGRELRIPVG